jgi:hypothetical protein
VDDADNYDIFAVGYGKHGRAGWTRRYGAGGDDQSFDTDVDPRGDAVLTDSFNLAVVKEDLKPSGFPTYEQVVQDVPAAAKVIVKLATPADSPPARKIGYYSDGAEHVALVTFSTPAAGCSWRPTPTRCSGRTWPSTCSPSRPSRRRRWR